MQLNEPGALYGVPKRVLGYLQLNAPDYWLGHHRGRPELQMARFTVTEAKRSFQVREGREVSCVAIKLRRQFINHDVCLGINELKQAA